MKTRKVLVMALAVIDMETGDKLTTKPATGTIVKANGKKVGLLFPTFVAPQKGLAAAAKAGHRYLERLVEVS
jgi:hypothetical protein